MQAIYRRSFGFLSLICTVFQIAAAPAFSQNASDDVADSAVYFNAAVKRPAAKADNSAKIEALLKQMTLEEKVGQMTQLAIDMVTTGKDQKSNT